MKDTWAAYRILSKARGVSHEQFLLFKGEARGVSHEQFLLFKGETRGVSHEQFFVLSVRLVETAASKFCTSYGDCGVAPQAIFVILRETCGFSSSKVWKFSPRFTNIYILQRFRIFCHVLISRWA